MPKLEEEIQEEIANSIDVENEEAPPIEDDEFDEDEYSVTTLTLKQKILLIFGGIITFLIFFILLFPLEEFIRSSISKVSSQKGYYIDFKKLKIPIFGSKVIDSLTIQTPDGLGLKSEEIEINSSFYNLAIYGSFSGSIQANSIKFDKKEISLNIKSILLEGKLNGLGDEMSQLNGNIAIQATNGMLVKIPILPMIGELKDTTIKNISIILKLKNGRFQIEKGILDTSIGRLSFKGKIEYTGNLGNSRIDLEICPKLSANFSAERPDLSDMLQVFSKGNPDFCVPIQGTMEQPKLNLPLGTGNEFPANPSIPPPPPPK
ncbi:MAG: type II secretion system protein GspN [Leptospiraceae bacterium]|nr:type II secretion system protein GspN [Leptospiraceae bacterium]MCK6379845.1 type II secretion system protein GspN [Leptospiraceae bacterium]NUM41659.1 type II secretion system protein GspN [Leptospiraceae bacterium]